ncbi:hypothetical protein VIGAN_05158500 [Vigna angularis var. angularis]|uniref:Uncharacterized protein n=1 Tax=Vigna angularis var. angularis TaxID=157739 RepID=A0A0S3S5M4_PHAAN|nr:hypothetical protein VIGAN_05158500 [Vigna angularis var. angularis]
MTVLILLQNLNHAVAKPSFNSTVDHLRFKTTTKLVRIQIAKAKPQIFLHELCFILVQLPSPLVYIFSLLNL